MDKWEFKDRLAKLQQDFKESAEKLKEKAAQLQEEFEKSFAKLRNLQGFVNLVTFELTLPEEDAYSWGFEILWDESLRDGCVKNWVRNLGEAKKDTKDFFCKLLPFADANGTGSFYCVWIEDESKPMDQLPIVVFGDEGGKHVVAENFTQLLHLLTYDEEISVDWTSVYFYKDEDDYEESEYHQAYSTWLKILHGMEPIAQRDETAQIISEAQDKYQEKFENWFLQYYNIADDEVED